MGPGLLYGAPPPGLAETPPGALQLSPLIPGSADVAELADASAPEAVVLAPGGSAERLHALAQVVRAVRPGGRLTVLAPKDRGGARLKAALEAFGCPVQETARRHHRICHAVRPERPMGLCEAIAAGAPRRLVGSGLWSQPGVFSWDRLDPGTAALIQALPDLTGRGADLGCGIGVLSQRVLASTRVQALTALDLDSRAVECARRNLDDPRVSFVWGDARTQPQLAELDFVVMNPPFHESGAENRGLGVAFLEAAAGMLRRGGVCWLVANRHLPYEAALARAFSRAEPRGDAHGYKIIEARR